MIQKLDKTILLKMADGTTAERLFIAEREFIYFAVYYFRQYFTYGFAEFHWQMFNDLMDLDRKQIDHLLWVMFRESAKTSFTKIFALWNICFNKKKYLNFDSYDKGNAEASLFDIAVQLQTNQYILRDFGHLFSEKITDEKKTLKRMSEFITTNDIKVQAFSTQESTRGRLYKEFRPDFYVFDDVENSKTVLSLPIIEKIKAHIDEALAGMAVGANAIFLGNLITEAGVIQYLINKTEDNHKFRYRRVDAEYNGLPIWQQKYVMTDAELIQYPNRVSLESKKKLLGSRVYATEMLNSPEQAGDLLFDRKRIDSLMIKATPPREEIAGLKVWENFNPAHRYAIGADTSAGVGRDHNASCVIDFSTLPNKVVATYKNNQIAPDIFAFELKRQGQKYGECLICPENNNTGFATITQLKAIYDISKIWRQNYGDKAIDKPTQFLGWEATGASMPEVVYQLKRAIEDGLLEVLDLSLLKEMRHYSLVDLQDIHKEGMTRHFDLMRACAIAWHMRNYAEVSKPLNQPLKQAEYESISSFEKPTMEIKTNNSIFGERSVQNNPFYERN